MEKRVDVVHEGKTLLATVRDARRCAFERGSIDEEDASIAVNEFFDKVQYALKHFDKFFDKDREMAEAGLTKDIGEVEGIGYSVVVVTDFGKAPAATGAQAQVATVCVVKKS
jgi:hypothetical protein